MKHLFSITYYKHLVDCKVVIILIIGLIFSCKERKKTNDNSYETTINKRYKTIGTIERISSELNAIISEDAVIEVLSDTLEWAEGPLWIPKKQWLLCSDVKEDKIYKWTENKGIEVYLEPSGFTGDFTDSREKGSNGLTLDADGVLTICQHGNRQVVKMNSDLDSPKVDFITIADAYEGKRFNSPNDLIYDSNGNLYFTDPPYGLSEKLLDDPKKELPFQGVFKVAKNQQLSLLTKAVTRPNGLALSPDEKTLYVANTDENNAAWIAFPIHNDGTLGEGEEFMNVTHLIGKEIGFPDGIKVDDKGNIFTAGPGGLWIFNSDKELIGKIKPGQWVSNCAFDEDYKTLYITADDYLLRVKL